MQEVHQTMQMRMTGEGEAKAQDDCICDQTLLATTIIIRKEVHERHLDSQSSTQVLQGEELSRIVYRSFLTRKKALFGMQLDLC